MPAMHRVTNAAVIAVGISAAVAPGVAQAQQGFPTKPVRVVVGFPPGSPADFVARLLVQKLAETWWKPVVVHKIAGARKNSGGNR